MRARAPKITHRASRMGLRHRRASDTYAPTPESYAPTVMSSPLMFVCRHDVWPISGTIIQYFVRRRHIKWTSPGRNREGGISDFTRVHRIVVLADRQTASVTTVVGGGGQEARIAAICIWHFSPSSIDFMVGYVRQATTHLLTIACPEKRDASVFPGPPFRCTFECFTRAEWVRVTLNITRGGASGSDGWWREGRRRPAATRANARRRARDQNPSHQPRARPTADKRVSRFYADDHGD